MSIAQIVYAIRVELIEILQSTIALYLDLILIYGKLFIIS